MRTGATPGLAHQVAFLHVEKLYLASTAAIWWPDGLWEGVLDLAQLYSLSCLFRAPWGHWDAGEEPSEKMDSPPGSPFRPRRANQAGKGSAVYTAALPTPAIHSPQFQHLKPLLALLPTHPPQVHQVLDPVLGCPQTQCCVPLSTHPWLFSHAPVWNTWPDPPHGLCSTNVVTSVSAMTCGSHLSCPP